MRTSLLLAALILLPPGMAVAGGVAPYGVPVRFAKDREIGFQDFSIRYLGERRVKSDIYPRGFLYYDFEVKGRKETKTASWSSGTGLIDAASFTVDGKAYELELRGTIMQKPFLKEDEFVLWPAAEFQKAMKSRRAN